MVEYTTVLNVVKEKILEEVYQTLRVINHKLNEKDMAKFTMIALIHIIKQDINEKISCLDSVKIEELAKELLKEIDEYELYPE